MAGASAIIINEKRLWRKTGEEKFRRNAFFSPNAATAIKTKCKTRSFLKHAGCTEIRAWPAGTAANPSCFPAMATPMKR